MKKVILLLFVVLLMTGCKVQRIDDKPIKDLVSIAISEKTSKTNVVGEGYKYYLPIEVERKSIDSYNEKLYSSGDVYYLFIDTVRYLSKSNIVFPKEKDAYYYEKFNNKGYIYISELKDKYFVKLYYGYAYIEAYVEKENLNSSVLNMITILKSVKLSKNILSLGKVKEEISNYEETFNIKPNVETSETVDILKLEEEYGKYTGPDIEIIKQQEQTTTDLESDIITKDSNIE